MDELVIEAIAELRHLITKASSARMLPHFPSTWTADFLEHPRQSSRFRAANRCGPIPGSS